MSMFSGLFTALVTPFKEGCIDFKSFDRLMRFQLDHGVEGFVIAGTTGESPCLIADEREKLLTRAKAFVSGHVPILLGTGSNSTAQTVLWTQEAERWGADGALVVTPYYNKPPQRGLFEHFRAVAASTSLPIVLYNVPGRTACDMSVETIAHLSEISNIVGVKEASGNLRNLEELVAKVPRSFTLISGDDASCMEFMRLGGAGVISVLSQVIPKEMRQLGDRARKGENVSAEFAKYARVTELLFVEANPIPVKTALEIMGIIETDEMRLPLMRLTAAHRAHLHVALEDIGVAP